MDERAVPLLHAVHYKLAIDKYIDEKGYSDIKTLVAFSD
jgi:type I restriction enzyme R subunit